jgi:translation initiation factor 2-alpha kinase 4
MPAAKASDTVRAVAVQIAIDKISNTLADYQSQIVENLVKEQRSFGYVVTPRKMSINHHISGSGHRNAVMPM